MTPKHLIWSSLFCSLAGTTLAGEFRLQSPIACDIGEDQPCYIQYYPDTDPGPGVSDFACGGLSYDGHKGTDFALRSLAQLNQDVAVLAAADGTVRGVRDGMPDQIATAETADQIAGKECGNGVVIAHEDGWETQYCHLARGSVTVRSGDRVTAGTPLGTVGLSGKTQFPHLHVSLRKDGKRVDPHHPANPDSCQLGGQNQSSLWETPPDYAPGGLISAGFSDGIPDYQAIKDGTAHLPDIGPNSPALVIWGFAFGAQVGDVMRLVITGPNGTMVSQNDVEITKTQPQLFRATGRRTNGAAWFTTGEYSGTVTLMRNGKTLSDIDTLTNVSP